MSTNISSAEENYSQTEKESLAIVDTVKKFHHYIHGRSLTIITDHKPLSGILGRKNLSL